ncbi:hypothetical protein FRC03_009559 [Tulasnella sp. 419]|nr:hypothetical protein FRC02_007038 [Tulasnella sp. 418]KAG8957984.1 hypothetical protein FRC03_009559 [Tulasnella sp. 419]
MAQSSGQGLLQNGTNGNTDTTIPANKSEEANASSSTSETLSPANRWETAFVWGFIARFLDIKGKVEGLESITDFENALLHNGPEPFMHAILAKFIDNLRPKKNTSLKQISSTLCSLINEMCNSSRERSIWWNKSLDRNVNPFTSDMDFFTLPWLTKLSVLRQLVEWQLSHTTEIRNLLDRAYGVPRGGHRKRPEDIPKPALPPPDDNFTKEKLQMIPIGLDAQRKRYWVVDDSPRLYRSGNPWKTTCPFEALSTTRDEYLAAVEKLKDIPQAPKKNGKLGKFAIAQQELTKKLEGEQLGRIDSELLRLSKVQKRIRDRIRDKEAREAREALAAAQVELRSTRTRTRTQKVDYVYDMQSDDGDDAVRNRRRENGDKTYEDHFEGEEEDADYFDDMDDDDGEGGSSRQRTRSGAIGSAQLRRSGRSTLKRSLKESGNELKGERRSSQIAKTEEDDGDDDYRPAKRSRVSSVASSAGTSLNDDRSVNGNGDAYRTAAAAISSLTVSGHNKASASSLRNNEKIVENVGGKRKSRFWYYAVETVPGSTPDQTDAEMQNGEDTMEAEPETSAPLSSAPTNPNEPGIQLESNGVSG